MEQTFEDFLISTFNEEEPESMVNKDRWQDCFDNWLECLGADMLIQYAEQWGSETYGQGFANGADIAHNNCMEMLKNK